MKAMYQDQAMIEILSTLIDKAVSRVLGRQWHTPYDVTSMLLEGISINSWGELKDAVNELAQQLIDD